MDISSVTIDNNIVNGNMDPCCAKHNDIETSDGTNYKTQETTDHQNTASSADTAGLDYSNSRTENEAQLGIAGSL